VTAGRDGDSIQADAVVVVDAEVDVSIPSCRILTLFLALEGSMGSHQSGRTSCCGRNKTTLGPGAGSLTTANAGAYF
jgi:hypothetical protein